MKTLGIDWDNTLHAYSSGWKGIDVIPDGPVPGAMHFLRVAVRNFSVQVHSSRSQEEAGRKAMSASLYDWLTAEFGVEEGGAIHQKIGFPIHKPPAFVSLDDRGLTFTGTWPTMEELDNFRPWNAK